MNVESRPVRGGPDDNNRRRHRIPGRRRVDGTALAQTEEDLQCAVVELAHLCGWMVFHPRPARTERGWRTALQGDAGYPDLTLVHRKQKRIACVELKSERGRVSEPQRRWLDALEEIEGVEVFTWRPSDWPKIERVLSRDVGDPR
jgi:hypothetical protein